MANIFKAADTGYYKLDRPKVTQAYLRNMVDYLKRQHPNASEDELNAFVEKTVRERITIPKVDLLTHPRYGVTKRRSADLLQCTSSLGANVISPAGVIYMPASKKRSILGEVLDESVALRNKYKHVQLEAAAVGDYVQEGIAKLLQASAKIFNNSIPGAMGTAFSFLYDLPGYNAVTSIGRQCVKTGYSHTERMLESNIYLTSVDDVINYSTQMLRVCPKDRVAKVVEKYGIAVPTTEMMLEWFNSCLMFYCNVADCEAGLRKYLATLDDMERTYIFYGYCYKNLLQHNETLMRAFFAKFFDRNVTVDPLSDPKEIFTIESDLLAMAMSLNFGTINHEAKLDEAIVNCPEGVKRLLAICHHMMDCINQWTDIFTTFFLIDADIPRLWEHPNMVRRCVLVSDTDSVIFSTDSIVQWYSPKERFSQDAYDINAFSVFMVSQTLEHLFARMGTGMGMEGGARRIKMKNEFYYPIFIRTAMAKHYAGAIFIQEGKILPKPKMDIKGINFRGSDLPSVTAKVFEEFVSWVLDELTKHSSLSASDFLERIAAHEIHIHESLMKGEKTFLPSKPVRLASEYKDPIVSDYFYYMLWQEVFEEDFGEFVIPNKGFVVPILGGGSMINYKPWREKLRAEYPGLEARLTRFQEQYPKKKISRIIFPPSVKEVPPIFREIVDARSIIYKNGRPFYLLARSFQLGTDDKSKSYIVSDFITLDNKLLELQH